MTKRPWMPLYVNDYLTDTKLLSPEQHGVYLLLLMVAWQRDGALLNDKAWLRRNLPPMHGRTYNALVPPILEQFFHLDEEGHWRSKRLQKEIEIALKVSRKQTENVSKRWAKTKENKELADTSVIPSQHSHSHSHKVRDRIVEGGSRFTEGSKALASAFWKALGFESPLHIPPQFAGVDWRAVSWESAGWTVDMIEAEARRIGPDKPLSYFEKVFATAFAKRQAPLPRVEILEPQPATVRQQSNGKSGNISAACDKLIAIARANYHGESTQDAFGFGAHEDTARILPYRRS